MKPLEQQLRAQERRPLPSSWKAEILENAAADLQARPTGGSATAWLFPRQLCGALAALWIATLTLQFLTPSSANPRRSTVALQKPAEPNAWLVASRSLLQQPSITYLDDVPFLD